MRSRPIDLVRAALVLAAVGAGAACIIGPKQDDPASGTAIMNDAAVTDTSTEYVNDSGLAAAPDGTADLTDSATDGSPPAQADGGCDAGDAGCRDAASDTAADSIADAPEGG
jgi:hypothetical protein